MTTQPPPRHTPQPAPSAQPRERAAAAAAARAVHDAPTEAGAREPWTLGFLEASRRVLAGALAGAAAAALSPGWELPLAGTSGLPALGALLGACATAGMLRARRVG
ncbi:hypothetical protein FOZ76_22200 [Verticiella sediminum]|uniref:Uncharacterized protein n=1 Tax=Verticiella sediminum TaxID=1247510 RepID=A0A556ACB0_9BURK|nr:hypothetical protein [Verticiella sediminum]TSH90524.1 hypothetical protein FOZ76_22200 [Verticiella sediminum]